MRTRLLGGIALTAVALAAAIIVVIVLGPRSPTTGAPPIAATEVPLPPVPQTAVRLEIPSIGVDAPVVTLSRDAQGNLAAPAGPVEAAWYDFTSRPGHAGNALFAGHLNWHDGRPGVFGHLGEVKVGADIAFIEDNGQQYHYRVVSVQEVDIFTTNVATVIDYSGGPESLTLITCSGQFVWTASMYAGRTLVRAERVPA